MNGFSRILDLQKVIKALCAVFLKVEYVNSGFIYLRKLFIEN